MNNTPISPPPDLPPPYPGFWRGVARGLLERILRLYYTARAPDTPRRLKIASLLAVAYLLFPFDLISDLLPLLGFGDDLFALALLARALSRYSDEPTLLRARLRALEIIP